jgi:prolyl-tRNA synthetase
VRRDQRDKGQAPLDHAVARTVEALEAAQARLLEEASAFRRARTFEATGVDEAEEAARSGFGILSLSALGEAGEDRLNAGGASVRCIHGRGGELALPEAGGGDVRTQVAVVARAY